MPAVLSLLGFNKFVISLLKWISSFPTTLAWVKCGEAESQLLCIGMLSVERCPFVPTDSQDQCSTGSSAGSLKLRSQMLIFSLPERIKKAPKCEECNFSCAAYYTYTYVCGNTNTQLLLVYLVLFSWSESNSHLGEDVIQNLEAIMRGKGDLLILKCIRYLQN